MFFAEFFSKNILKNHNIGPRLVCEKKIAQNVAQTIFGQKK
jgi:hypothetical protein